MRRITPAARELLLLLLPLSGLLVLTYRLDLFAGPGPRPAWLAPWSADELLLLLAALLVGVAGYAWRRCREYRRLLARLRAAEAAARELERRLHFVVSQAPLVLFALDAAGVFTMVEGRGLVSVGLAPPDLLGHSILEVFRDAPQVLAVARRALAGEEFAAITPFGGAVFETRHTVLRDERGAGAGLVGVALDVTAREQATQALVACETQRARDLLLLHRLQVGLTPQEGRILDLLDAGRNIAAIAAALHIQRRTVGTHIHNLGVKLGLPSGRIGQADVLAIAHERGLLASSPPPATGQEPPTQG